MMHIFYRSLLILLITTFCMLTACATDQPSKIITIIRSVGYLNPDINNQPSPVVVTMYQLKSATTFQQANFFALFNNASDILGKDLLNKQEIEIQPQQKQTLEQNVSADTSYIGIIAAFRNLDNAQWRQVVLVKPGKNIKLIINLSSQNISTKLN